MRRFRVGMAFLAAAFLSTMTTGGGSATEISTGGFSFSDELGGFRLISASGSGSPGDPVVVVEEIEEVAPVTLIIRRSSGSVGAPIGFLQLTLVKVVVNRSNRVWAGFELELQEILRRPSVYGDGLSFNQTGAAPPDVASDSFAADNRLFEPYDRIHFQNGHVDPGATVQFRLIITDPTPLREFYLVQDPKLLSVERERSTNFADARSADPGQ
jgi:hypothetical protein